MIFTDVREKLLIPRRMEMEKELNVWKNEKHTLENVPDVTQNQNIRTSDLSPENFTFATQRMYSQADMFTKYTF